MTKKRKLFDEMMEGTGAMQAQREGKITLRSHEVDDLPPLADLSDWESLRVQLNLPEVEDTTEDAPQIPDLPVLYPEVEDEEEEDESEFLSDAEIDAINQRIPDLVAVDEAVEESIDEDQDASASGG